MNSSSSVTVCVAFVLAFGVTHSLLFGGLYKYGYKCNATQLEKIEKAEILKQRSRCPTRGFWFDQALHYSLNRHDVTVVSVGCNKGDDLVSLMASWSGNKSYNVTNYKNHMRAKYPSVRFACGKGARHHSYYSQQIPIRHVRGYCIEPMPINQELLRYCMYDATNFTKDAMSIVPAAMDTLPGIALFPNFLLPGVEHLGLGHLGASGSMAIPINVINLDNFIAGEDLDIIDHLSIDAEGYDGRVLLGAAKSLASGKIRIVEFEYGSSAAWKTMDLSLIVDFLDVLHYDCFWMGDRGELWRLTGCWLSRYKEPAWSNIVCVHRHLEADTHMAFTNYSTFFM